MEPTPEEIAQAVAYLLENEPSLAALGGEAARAYLDAQTAQSVIAAADTVHQRKEAIDYLVAHSQMLRSMDETAARAKVSREPTDKLIREYLSLKGYVEMGFVVGHDEPNEPVDLSKINPVYMEYMAGNSQANIPPTSNEN